MLSQIIYAFEAAYQRGDVPRLQDFVPADTPDRGAVLAELARVDLEYRRKRGLPICVDAYLTPFPELEADPDLLLELIEADYRQRQDGGERPAADAYAVRFPALAQRLAARLSPPTGDMAATAPSRAPGPPGLPEVPGYDVLAVLGEGGMGMVYQARHKALGRLVALKTIKGGGQVSPGDRQRFRTEAETVARLQHPNIVQIFEVGEYGDCPYLALEYAEGGSLDRELAGRPWPPKQSAEIVRALALALQHAHEQGVIHRDLKPANVLIGAKGVLKVTDFGLARRADASAHTMNGSILGTPSYMAPEQAAGDPKAVGATADVWALGAILYECLTGRPPFRGPTPLDTVAQVLNDEPVPPRRRCPQVPRDLETVCLQALAKEPARRYPTAQALAEDLERFRTGEPVRARRQGPLGRLWRKVRRRPAATAALAAVVLALAVVTAVGLRAGQDRRVAALHADLEAVLDARDWSGPPLARAGALLADLDRLAPERAAAARRRLQGRMAASIHDALGQPRLAAADVTRLEGWIDAFARLAPGQAPALRQALRARLRDWETVFDLKAPFPGWENVLDRSEARAGPDGLRPRPDPDSGGSGECTLLSRVACEGNVQLEAEFGSGWETAARLGLLLDANPQQAGPVCSLAYSPDGKRLATCSGNKGPARVWDAATGQALLTLEDGQPCAGARFAPDGKRLLVARRQNVSAWDTDSRRRPGAICAHPESISALAVSPDGKVVATGGKAVCLWDAASGAAVATLGGPGGGVNALAFGPGGLTLLVGRWDRSVAVWDVAARRERLRFTPDQQWARAALAPDGKALAVAGGHQVRLWDADSGAEREPLKNHRPGGVSVAAFAHDSRTLAAGCIDGTVLVYDVPGRRLTAALRGLRSRVECLAFAPDGRTLAAGGVDGTIHAWDVHTGAKRLTIAGQGYAFVLAAPGAGGAGGRPGTLGAAQRAEGSLRMQIFRDGILQREQPLRTPVGPVRLRASRAGDELKLQVNEGPPLVFRDLMPRGGPQAGVFGLLCDGGATVTRLRASRQALPPARSPLEHGDALFARGQYADSLAYYRDQAIGCGSAAVGREARCKAALCLVRLNRPDEAAPLLEQVAGEEGERWPLTAACQLWLLRLRQDRDDDAEAVFASIAARHRFEELAVLIPEDLRGGILNDHRTRGVGYLFATPAQVRRLERGLAAADLFRVSPGERLDLLAALHRTCQMTGQKERAARVMAREFLPALEAAVRDPDSRGGLDVASLLGEYCWAVRLQGEPRRALAELERWRRAPDGHWHVGEPGAGVPALVERARIDADLKDWERAEADLDEFFRRLPPRKPGETRFSTGDYTVFSTACLVQGFLRERRGDGAGAAAAWRRGLWRSWLRDYPEDAAVAEHEAVYGTATLNNLIMASLTGELTDAEAEQALARVAGGEAGGQAGQLLKLAPIRVGPILRAMWRTPRGKDCARRIAFRTVPFAEYVRLPVRLTIAEAFRQGALPGELTPEQDAILWQTAGGLLDGFTGGKLTMPRVLQLGLTWKGVSNALGWAAVAPQLEPGLRGPFAYVAGHRYLRLERPGDAAAFFRTALQDAPAGSALARLAGKELARLRAN